MKMYLIFFLLMVFLLAGSAHADDDWTKILSHPSARDEHATAYLEGDQVVMFGGHDFSGLDGETWTYDLGQNAWIQVETSTSPAARYCHSMAWLGGDQALMFGGNTFTSDTWVFDLGANEWVEKAPAANPGYRTDHAMAYIGDDQVLLFGGYDIGGYDDETWVYDLSEDTWTQMFPTGNPGIRRWHAMAYIGEDKVLLFGGSDTHLNDETWIYDLSEDTWTQILPTTSPSPRWDHDMAYVGDDQVVLFGGYDNVGPTSNETWVYDLSDSAWTLMTPATGPSARELHAMSYIGGDQVLLFGGDDGAFWADDTWVYDLSANTWTQMIPPASPSERHSHAMASLGGDQALLFGGYCAVPLGNSDETWTYDLSEQIWTQMSPPTAPSARRRHAMAHIGTDQVLLFGGYDSSRDDETWVYDLNADTWTQMMPAAYPSARYRHAMAWVGGDQVVLFGGDDGSSDDETWIYDLSEDNWTQKFPSTQPSARRDHAMAFIGGDQALLFGWDNQTWLYDLSANTWTQVALSTGPAASIYLHAMALLRDGQVLMFGGHDYTVPVGDTWVFDISDSNWTQLAPANSPSERYLPTMANLGSGQVVMFGGYGDDFLDETWEYGSSGDLTPPDAIDDLAIALEDGSKSATGNMCLWWSEPYDEVGVSRYVVYRSTDPSSTGDSIAGTFDTTYTDVGVAGDTLSNYFYVVEAVDSTGNRSEESNQVGEFDRRMTNVAELIAEGG
jgi:N-acetylneuraminic acid mutarotase